MQLAQTVADNVLALDQKWWLRLATRNDAAVTPEEKQRLSSLASTVMAMMDVSHGPKIFISCTSFEYGYREICINIIN